MVTGKRSGLFHIRIEGSADGEDWTLLADTKTKGLEVFRAPRFGERAVLSEKLEGDFRYLKLLAFGARDKNTPKTVAALEIYAENTEEAETGEAAGTDEAPFEKESPPDPAESAPEKTSSRGKPSLKTAALISAGLLTLAGALAFILRGKKKGSADRR